MIGTAVVIVGALIVVIWILVEVQRLKHKIWAFALIALILFTYLSFMLVLKEQNIDYKSAPGLLVAGRIYFSWLGGLFGNFRTMTAHAISLDWYPDEAVEKIQEEK